MNDTQTINLVGKTANVETLAKELVALVGTFNKTHKEPMDEASFEEFMTSIGGINTAIDTAAREAYEAQQEKVAKLAKRK